MMAVAVVVVVVVVPSHPVGGLTDVCIHFQGRVQETGPYTTHVK